MYLSCRNLFPGAIAINSATFIGYRIARVRWAFAAMAGVLLPTFLIVIGLSISFLYFKEHPKMEAAFEGIRPVIVALISFAGYKIGKMAVFDKTTLALVIVTVLFLLVVHLHPVLIILSGAVVGIILVKIKGKLGFTTRLDNHEEKDSFDTDYFMGSGI